MTVRTLWEKVSPYIRQRDADQYGYCYCISCGKKAHWKEMDAGHFIPKSKNITLYFDPDNIHAQCPGCNRFGSQDTGYAFGKALEKKIGKERMGRLASLKHSLVNKQDHIDKMEKVYKKLCSQIQPN